MKKSVIIILFALLIGSGLACFVFKNSVRAETEIKTTKVKAFQIGVFKTIENAQRVAGRNNGIVVIDDDLYRVYVAIVKNEEAMKKISSYFDSLNMTYYIRNVSINDDYIDKLVTYEELINKSSSETYNTILTNLLNDYEEYYELYD